MLIKKNLATNIIWFLFVILTFSVLLVTSTGIATRMGKDGDVLFIGISYFIILVGSILIFGLSLLFKKIIDFSSLAIQKDSAKFLEFLYLLFFVILLIMIRFIYLVNNGDVISGDITYYNLAINNNFEEASKISPLTYLYVKFLAYLFTSYGTSKLLCMYIQIVFHLIIFLCTYYSLKYLINPLAGIVGSSLFTFISYFINEVSYISPGALLNAVFSLSFLLLIYSCYNSNRNKLNRLKLFLYFIVSGISTGIFAFLDYSGIAFIIIAIVFILFLKNSNKERKIYSPKIQIPLYVFGIVIGFISCYLIKAIWEKSSFIELVINDYNFHNYNFSINLYIDSPAFATYISALLVGLSFLWLIRIFSIERDYGSPIILFAFFVCLFSFISLSRDSYIPLITLLYIHLATYGFISLGDNKITDEDIAKIEAESDSIDNRIKEDDAKEKELNKKKLEEKKKELSEIRKKEKENKMQKKNVTSGINTTLTLSEEEISDAADLDFLKNMQPKEKETVNTTNSINNNTSSQANNNPIYSPITVNKTTYSPLNKAVEITKASIEETVNASAIIPETIKEDTGNNTITISNNNKKYGKRMDYKTAIVKSSTSNLYNNDNVKEFVPIKNPLPTPAKRVPREMDFDIIPAESEMHFDIVDLKNKDFFDIN